jgi:heat shock protein 1/8
MSKIAIGIDLGTCYSSVGVYRNGNVDIIANDQGNRTTPSYVAFNETERMVGESAKNQASSNCTNTIYNAKRLIGKTFSDSMLQSDIKKWPFSVKEGEGNKPVIVVQHEGNEKNLSPEEISSMVLVKMKETAEAFLGEKVTDAVVTVPAYFNDQQRRATKDAASIAGLNVLRIINEPTAAALAYGLSNKTKTEQNVLIFDLGGGTFDVSLLSIDDGVFEVKATAGDTHLGGEDFDQRLVDHFAKEILRKTKKDVTTNDRAMRRLRTSCERVKRTLSSMSKASIEIESLIDGVDFNGSITRARFEDLCIDYFRGCLIPVEKVLKDSKISKSEVHEIVLVGGSTRIPKIQSLISEFFNGKELSKSINPDEAVAYGAAVQAGILGDNEGSSKDILLIDVTPLSLGIETAGNIMTNIIDRNSTIPCKKTKIFSTYEDNQPAVTLQVFEGERSRTSDNHQLGKFNLEGIPPAPRGKPQIEVTFDMDANGLLTVTAQDKDTGKENKITIDNDAGRLNKDEIEDMIKKAAEYADQDASFLALNAAKNGLEGKILSLRQKLQESATGLFEEEEKLELDEFVTEALEWVQADTLSESEIEEREKLVDERLASLFKKQQENDVSNASNVQEEEKNEGPKVEEVD